jgi:ABC-2 type transport system ATP-binding protein
MSTRILIEINNFVKEYKSCRIKIDKLLIKDKVTLVIGENGSGKSTLFKAISELIQYEGEIIMEVKISYMSEFPKFPIDVTVNQFLTRLSNLGNDISIDFLELLDYFDLINKIDEYISSLSKGMKAKLNLIQCLMIPAELYILDEPLSGLDYDSVEKLIQYINEENKSFLISSHLENAFSSLQKQVILL